MNLDHSLGQKLNTPAFADASFILLDIEGTTSDIHFVKEVLFPYSARELRRFISENKTNPTVQKALSQVGESTDEECIQKLLSWIEDDVKHPALKSLQGLIWRKGFVDEIFRAHVYEDVLVSFKIWHKLGFKLGIYSSGSVAAQKLYFAHTIYGDLTNYLCSHFDLDVGSKREPTSYSKIAKFLNLTPEKILFLSDIEAELDAAQSVGMKSGQIVRPGTTPSSRHLTFSNLTLI